MNDSDVAATAPWCNTVRADNSSPVTLLLDTAADQGDDKANADNSADDSSGDHSNAVHRHVSLFVSLLAEELT